MGCGAEDLLYTYDGHQLFPGGLAVGRSLLYAPASFRAHSGARMASRRRTAPVLTHPRRIVFSETGLAPVSLRRGGRLPTPTGPELAPEAL
jgi:hypothetical protein